MRIKSSIFFTSLFVILLIISLFVRLSLFDYPLAVDAGEGNRDYLAGHGILKHGELPLVGPYSATTNDLLKNSPLYYYSIAGILSVFDNIIFLGIVNIVLQVLILILIYLFVKEAFGHAQAFIAALFYSFPPEILRHSGNIWQPYFMNPFVVLSYVLLLYAYTKKSFLLLALALFTILFAGAIHNAAFGVFPLFLLLVLLILRLHKYQKKHYLQMVLLISVTLALFYTPVVIEYLLKGSDFVHNTQTLFTLTIETFLSNTQRTILELFRIFSFGFGITFFNLILVSFFSICIMCYFTIVKRSKEQKIITAIILGCILWQVLLVSVFTKTHPIFQLIPVLALFPIFFSEILISTLSSRFFLKVTAVLLIIILLNISTNNFYFLRQEPSGFKNIAVVNNASGKLEDEINEIKKKEGSTNEVGLFSLRTGSFGVYNSVLLTPSEDTLGWEFIRKNITDGFPSHKKHIFLSCFNNETYYSREVCKKTFLKFGRNYTIEKEVYNSPQLTIYLASKTN